MLSYEMNRAAFGHINGSPKADLSAHVKLSTIEIVEACLFSSIIHDFTAPISEPLPGSD